MQINFSVVVPAILAVMLWGLWGFWGKIGLLQRMPALNMFLVEVSIGFLIGVIVLILMFINDPTTLWNQHWSVFGIMSGAALAMGLFVYYLALEKGQASIVVPVTSTYPIVTILLSTYFLNEDLTPIQWIGGALVITGMLLLLSRT